VIENICDEASCSLSIDFLNFDAASEWVCATLMHHYQWKCAVTASLREGDSLSMHVDVSQFVSQ
jgi:hypothetical protein